MGVEYRIAGIEAHFEAYMDTLGPVWGRPHRRGAQIPIPGFGSRHWRARSTDAAYPVRQLPPSPQKITLSGQSLRSIIYHQGHWEM